MRKVQSPHILVLISLLLLGLLEWNNVAYAEQQFTSGSGPSGVRRYVHRSVDLKGSIDEQYFANPGINKNARWLKKNRDLKSIKCEKRVYGDKDHNIFSIKGSSASKHSLKSMKSLKSKHTLKSKKELILKNSTTTNGPIPTATATPALTPSPINPPSGPTVVQPTSQPPLPVNPLVTTVPARSTVPPTPYVPTNAVPSYTAFPTPPNGALSVSNTPAPSAQSISGVPVQATKFGINFNINSTDIPTPQDVTDALKVVLDHLEVCMTAFYSTTGTAQLAGITGSLFPTGSNITAVFTPGSNPLPSALQVDAVIAGCLALGSLAESTLLGLLHTQLSPDNPFSTAISAVYSLQLSWSSIFGGGSSTGEGTTAQPVSAGTTASPTGAPNGGTVFGTKFGTDDATNQGVMNPQDFQNREISSTGANSCLPFSAMFSVMIPLWWLY